MRRRRRKRLLLPFRKQTPPALRDKARARGKLAQRARMFFCKDRCVSQHTARLRGPDGMESARKKSSRRPKSARVRSSSARRRKAPALKTPNMGVIKGTGRSRGSTSRLFRSAPSLAPPERAPLTHNSLGSGLWCTFFCALPYFGKIVAALLFIGSLFHLPTQRPH